MECGLVYKSKMITGEVRVLIKFSRKKIKEIEKIDEGVWSKVISLKLI